MLACWIEGEVSPPNTAMRGVIEDGRLDTCFHTQFYSNLRQGTVCPFPQSRRHLLSLPGYVGLRQWSRMLVRAMQGSREMEALQFLSQLRWITCVTPSGMNWAQAAVDHRMFGCQHKRRRGCEDLLISEKSGWSFLWPVELRSRKCSLNPFTESLRLSSAPPTWSKSKAMQYRLHVIKRNFTYQLHFKVNLAILLSLWLKKAHVHGEFLGVFSPILCPCGWKDFIIANVNVFSTQTICEANVKQKVVVIWATEKSLLIFLGMYVDWPSENGTCSPPFWEPVHLWAHENS